MYIFIYIGEYFGIKGQLSTFLLLFLITIWDVFIEKDIRDRERSLLGLFSNYFYSSRFFLLLSETKSCIIKP